MQDAWRAYLEMALGLTEAPRKRAQKVAGELVNRGGATAAQLQGLVEDLMSTGMANREALTNIVRYEVDRALGKVGLATADEVEDLTTRVRDLERQLRAAQGRADAAAGSSSGTLIAADAAASGGGIGGDRLNQPAPLPAKVAKKAVAKKAVNAPPNAMPKAASPRPAKTGGPAGPRAAAKKVAGPSTPDAGPTPAGNPEPPAAPAADLPPTAGTTSSAPAKKAAARKATAKKASPAADAAPARKAGPAKAGRAKKAAPAPDTSVTQPEA